MPEAGSVGNLEDLTPQGNEISIGKPKALSLRARCLPGIGLGYVQGSYFSQIPFPMDHEFVENEKEPANIAQQVGAVPQVLYVWVGTGYLHKASTK